MSAFHVLSKSIADLDQLSAAMKAQLATLSPCFPDRHCESCPHAAHSVPPSPAPSASAISAPSAPATSASAPRVPKIREPAKNFALIQTAFTGAKVYVESHGERWIGTVALTGISFNGQTFRSPTGFCSAHAARITEKHPQPTDAGSGWKFVKMLEGEYKGKNLSFVHDALKGSPPPANQAPEAQVEPMPDLLEQAYESADEWGSADLAAREIPEVPRNEIILPRAEPGIPFVCMRNIKDALTQTDISERGGTFHMHDNIWKFNSDLPDAKSPSGACCAVLKRKEGSKTNQWDGPKHILLKIDEVWKPYYMVLPTSRAGGFA